MVGLGAASADVLTIYTYDVQGQVKSVARPLNTTGYAYDAAGNRTQLSFTLAGAGRPAGGETSSAFPIASPDQASVHPGETIAILALANDSDPNGGPLKITSVSLNGAGNAAISADGGQISFTAPATLPIGKVLSMTYTILNDQGGTAFSTIHIQTVANN